MILYIILWVLECSRVFSYKSVAIASSLYATLVYEKFHKNAIFCSSEENLYIINLAFQIIWGKTDYSVNGIEIVG